MPYYITSESEECADGLGAVVIHEQFGVFTVSWQCARFNAYALAVGDGGFDIVWGGDARDGALVVALASLDPYLGLQFDGLGGDQRDSD